LNRKILTIVLAAIVIAAGIGGYLIFQSSSIQPLQTTEIVQTTQTTETPQTTPTSSNQQSNQTVPIEETPKPSSNQSTSGQQAITVEEFLKHFGKYAWYPNGTVRKDVIIIGKLYKDDRGPMLLGPPYKDTVLWLVFSNHNVTDIEDGVVIDGTIIIKVGDTVIVKGGWRGTEGELTTEFSKYYVGFDVIEIRKVS
jgi:hypothetical protein